MRKFFTGMVSVALVCLSQNSFGWSKYIAHRVVSEDISRELGVDRDCLKQVAAAHLGISLDAFYNITSKELGNGGIDLPDDSEKSKVEYAYLYAAASRCPK
jgi:hypothetical protein